MQAVALYLREVRNAAGLTQPQAAERVGINPKTVERWEAGKHEPPASELAVYVHKIGGDVAELLRRLVGDDQIFSDEDAAWFASLSPAQKRKVRALLDAAEDRL